MLRCELHPDSGLVVVDQYDVSLSDGAWHKVRVSHYHIRKVKLNGGKNSVLSCLYPLIFHLALQVELAISRTSLSLAVDNLTISRPLARQVRTGQI